MVEEIKKKLHDEIENFKQYEKDYHKALLKRQQLEGQLNENIIVKQELDLLKSNNEVFKLIGPALIKQELIEAKENVNKRIEFISTEMKHTEDLIETLDKKQEMRKNSLEKLQQSLQQAQNPNVINTK